MASPDPPGGIECISGGLLSWKVIEYWKTSASSEIRYRSIVRLHIMETVRSEQDDAVACPAAGHRKSASDRSHRDRRRPRSTPGRTGPATGRRSGGEPSLILAQCLKIHAAGITLRWWRSQSPQYRSNLGTRSPESPSSRNMPWSRVLPTYGATIPAQPSRQRRPVLTCSPVRSGIHICPGCISS